MNSLQFETSVIYMRQHGNKTYLAVVNSSKDEHAAVLGKNVAILAECTNDTAESKQIANQEFDSYSEAVSFLESQWRHVLSQS